MDSSVIQSLNVMIAGNTILDYLVFLLILALITTILKLFRDIVIKKLQKLSEKTRTLADDFIINQLALLGWPLYLILSLYISLRFLVVPGIIGTAVTYLTLIVVIYYIGKAVHELIDFGTRRIIKIKEDRKESINHAIVFFFGKFLKVVFWVVVAILLISNLGYDVSALVAGLGIGGIAVALALQNVLRDVFSSLSIYFDKPFEIGDFIVVGDDMGVVKMIGIKSTRLQTLRGEELVISNSELTGTRVHNYKKMERRRIIFTIGVTYETSSKKLEKIPAITKKIFEEIDNAELDRVHFKTFGDFSLNYEIVYYVASGDYYQYMDTQQKVNLAIKKAFEKEKIDFAYPTQTVFMKK